MCILHANGPMRALLYEWSGVQFVDHSTRHGLLEDCMCFLEIAFHNLNFGALQVRRSMGFEELEHILPQSIVAEMRMEKAHPQNSCCLARHDAGTLVRHMDNLWRWFCRVTILQCLPELGTYP